MILKEALLLASLVMIVDVGYGHVVGLRLPNSALPNGSAQSSKSLNSAKSVVLAQPRPLQPLHRLPYRMYHYPPASFHPVMSGGRRERHSPLRHSLLLYGGEWPRRRFAAKGSASDSVPLSTRFGYFAN